MFTALMMVFATILALLWEHLKSLELCITSRRDRIKDQFGCNDSMVECVLAKKKHPGTVDRTLMCDVERVSISNN